MSLETNVATMWAPATGEANPISADTSKAWKFGIHAMPYQIPLSKKEIAPNYYSSLLPDSHTVVKSSVIKAMAFWPCNGIWWYYWLGKVVNLGDNNQHTVSVMSDGDALPNFVWRSEQSGGSAAKYLTSVGCVIGSYQETYSFIPAGGPSTGSVSIFGINDNGETLSAAHNGAVEPTDDGLLSGTSRTDLYKKDSNTSFKWNTNQKVTQLQQVIVSGSTLLKDSQIDGQAEIEYLFSGSKHMELNCDFFRGVDNDIVNDYQSETTRAIEFQSYNTATRYKKFTASNAIIDDIIGPHDPRRAKDQPPEAWRVVFRLDKTLSILILDGTHDDFYTPGG